MAQRQTITGLVCVLLVTSGCTTIDASQPKHRTVFVAFDAASDAYVDQLQQAGELEPSSYFAQSRRRGYARSCRYRAKQFAQNAALQYLICQSRCPVSLPVPLHPHHLIA